MIKIKKNKIIGMTVLRAIKRYRLKNIIKNTDIVQKWQTMV